MDFRLTIVYCYYYLGQTNLNKIVIIEIFLSFWNDDEIMNSSVSLLVFSILFIYIILCSNKTKQNKQLNSVFTCLTEHVTNKHSYFLVYQNSENFTLWL